MSGPGGEFNELPGWSVLDQCGSLWVGVEAEYLLRRGPNVFDFSEALHGLDIGTPHLVPGDENARWLASGAMLTCEGAELELALPPTPVAGGPALTRRLQAERGRLERILPGGLEWTPVSVHLSVSVPEAEVERTAHAFLRRYAPSLLGCAPRRGVEVRVRYGRVELKLAGYDAMGAEWVARLMAAGIRDILGAARGEDRSLPPPRLLDTVPVRDKYGWRLDAAAKRPPRMVPVRARAGEPGSWTSAIQDTLRGAVGGESRVRLVLLTWSDAVLEVLPQHAGRAVLAAMPTRVAPRFLRLVESGRLGSMVERFLEERRPPLVLRSPDQFRQPALFHAIGPLRHLRRPDPSPSQSLASLDADIVP